MKKLTEFEKLILPEVIGCPRALVTQALKHSVIDFAEQSWIFSKSFNESISSSDIDTTLNDSVDINVGEYVTDKVPIAVAEFKINGLDWKLKYMNLENESNYIENLRDSDEKLFCFPDDGTMRIHEIDSGDELFIKLIYKPTFEITETDDTLYNDWAEPVIAGAKARLMTMPNQPWSNSKLATYYHQLFRRGYSQAKRKVQKDFTQLPKRVNWVSFEVR